MRRRTQGAPPRYRRCEVGTKRAQNGAVLAPENVKRQGIATIPALNVVGAWGHTPGAFGQE